MRLFLAMDPPAKVQAGLEPLTREEIRGAKWGLPAQRHLTLRFLGEVGEEAKQSLVESLKGISGPPFQCGLQGVGVFPSPRRPSVLWVGFTPCPALFALQEILELEVQKLGFAREPKPFHPHLTLARFKTLPAADLGAFLQKYRDFSLPAFEVREFHLYSSHLSPKGSEYSREASFPLNA
ncbi:MAG: RNA 2',3'-cyclic phosphodiesterase [Deltaproteobacteria bacterium]|nr:RNA 2',3'-cyclic phosphodiesterase [Deltaproteobacteria bacterium]